jgi:uncharacterized protein
VIVMKSLLLTLLLPALVMADVPAIERPVTDPTGMLTAQETETVSQALVALRAERQVHMAVVLVPTTESLPIEDYAREVFAAWQGGEKGLDNGLLLVVARDDRRMRLESGYGVEAALTDGEARTLLDAQGPKMREGRLEAALVDIIAGVRREIPEGGLAAAIAAREAKEQAKVASGWLFAALVVVAPGVGGLLLRCWRRTPRRPRDGVAAVLLLVVSWACLQAVASSLRVDVQSFMIIAGLLMGWGVIGWHFVLAHRDRWFHGAGLLAFPVMNTAFFFQVGFMWDSPWHLLMFALALFPSFFLAKAFFFLLADVIRLARGQPSRLAASLSLSHLKSSTGSGRSRSSSSSSSSSRSSSSSSSSSSNWRGGGGSSGGGGASSSW